MQSIIANLDITQDDVILFFSSAKGGYVSADVFFFICLLVK